MEHEILKIVNKRRKDHKKSIKECYDEAAKYRAYTLTRAIACDKYAQSGLFPLVKPTTDGSWDMSDMRDESVSPRTYEGNYHLLENNLSTDKYAFEPNAAIGVNTMCAKIIEAVFPTVVPYFELKPSLRDQIKLSGKIKTEAIQKVQQVLQQQSDNQMNQQVQTGQPITPPIEFDPTNGEHLSLLNNTFEELKADQRQVYNDYTLFAFDYIKKTFLPEHQYMSILLYLVTGPFLLYMKPDPIDEADARESIKVIPLDKFTIVDGPDGNIVEICIREQYHVDAVPDELWDAIEAVKNTKSNDAQYDKVITIYEMIRFKTETIKDKNGKITGHKKLYCCEKEFEHYALPGTYYEGQVDDLPYIINRPLLASTSSYGSPYMAQFIPLLEDSTNTKNQLRTILFNSAAFSVIVDQAFLKEHEIDDILSMKNKVFASANNSAKDAAHGIHFNIGPELQVASNMYQESIQIIQSAFMQNSSAQRDSERTTKGEIMVVVDELKKRMSLTYTQLEGFSGEIVKRAIKQMKHLGIWDLKNKVEPQITIGIGKVDLNQKADTFIEMLGILNQLLSQLNPVLLQSLDVNHFIDMVMASKGFQADMLLSGKAVSAGLEEQVKQAQKQQEAMQMMQMLQGAQTQ